jgi:hypothetical protein
LYFYLGKEAAKDKGEPAETGLPSKTELKKTIIRILKKVDFNTVTVPSVLAALGPTRIQEGLTSCLTQNSHVDLTYLEI